MRRFHDFGAAGRPDLRAPPVPGAEPGDPNVASRIDTRLASKLDRLAAKTLPTGETFDMRNNLAFRNLARAKSLGLATGQEIAALLEGAGPLPEGPPVRLTPDQILEGDRGADLRELTPDERDALVESTPLWFYVLREAELNCGRLRGVGGRLVAETFHRAMAESEHSIVTDAAFRPHLAPPVPPGAPSSQPGVFGMPELLLYAFEGRGELLNPLGD